MEGKLKMGIVGCGNSAKNIHYRMLKAITEKIEVAACFDKDGNRAAEVGGIYDAKPYDSLDSFLDHPGLDLVLVATRPPTTHAEIGLAALEAGKHVLLEKPICETHEEGIRLIEKANEKDRILTVFQNRRGPEWDPDFAAARWGIEQGYFGDVRIFESIWCGNLLNPAWMHDWGIHIFDQVLSIMKEKPVEISSGSSFPEAGDIPCGPWVAFIRFENGKIGVASMRIGLFGEYPRFSIIGDKGGCAWPARSARVENPGVNELSCDIPSVLRGREEEAYEPFNVKIKFTPFYENLYAAITGGAELIVKPEEALRALDVTNAAIKSVKTAGPVLL